MPGKVHRLLPILLTIAVISAAPAVCHGWSSLHYRVSQAAFNVQPDPLRTLWSQSHLDPYDTAGPRPISTYFASYGWYTGNPDHHDGPNPPDIDRKRYISNFLYGELAGVYAKPVPYGDPDYTGTRPWTFHYLSFAETENRARTVRAAAWGFNNMVDAFVWGQYADAAQFAGTMAHTIEDRSSAYHAWDGYSVEREQLETDNNIQGPNPGGMSDFWRVSDAAALCTIDTLGYIPVLLGTTPEEAAETFADRLQAVCDFSRAMNMGDFLFSHLNDDWENMQSSPATDAIMTQMANVGGFLLADTVYTAYQLSLWAVPEPGTLLLVLVGASCALGLGRRRRR